jgi:ankyrin repeat protein
MLAMTDNASQLVAAVKKPDIRNVREIIGRDPSVVRAAHDENGLSILMIARYVHRLDLVDVLLTAHPVLNLFEAAALGRLEEIRDIIAREPFTVSEWSVDGFSPLHLAAYFGQYEAARLLLEGGAVVSVVSRNWLGVTPLHSAVAGRHRELVELLLSRGSAVNARQSGGWTALHSAAQYGDNDTVAILLQHGADISTRNADGKRAADLARDAGYLQLTTVLEPGS